ncbi:unnamed protein product [Rotaria magnacalcarata]|uniref:Nicotinate phosphoribosyltransferase n=3 Tax=Rotaria magnacalcarata TaxID=392030 RepID=A0A819M3D6_9BILA|nr:unnamed protein product [Rotaria magnacalcarata]CAF1303587.1 unnamed protein product [Rotaria magnacalcarata]CAF2143004.1 unnamed protein product [Rotaria magnacalcarata]CAF2211952.1 unnamed protein product [Rotaria magnacalcarata]CAF2220489.1 unnamed protein product [Rotaria magnacalcarata]
MNNTETSRTTTITTRATATAAALLERTAIDKELPKKESIRKSSNKRRASNTTILLPNINKKKKSLHGNIQKTTRIEYNHQHQNDDRTKLVDSQSQPAPSAPLSPYVEIESQNLVNTSLIPLPSSQTLPLHSEERFKPSFRNSVSPRGSLTSIASEKVLLMSSEQQSSVVQPLLTDLYQISMAYAYWKPNKHQEIATFDLYFRKNPFGGEYTLFAGLDECLKFVRDYKFHSSDIDYLRASLPNYIESEFYDYLSTLDMNDIKIHAVPEGTVVFPRLPLMRIEGPVLKTQLLETTLLTLVNYASLVATNAARFRSAIGADKTLLEFGLRRAQGPDGGLSASKYCYLGGFDGTSNVLAGKLYGIPIKGTHAHAYVNSYESMEDLCVKDLCDRITGVAHPFSELCLKYLKEIGPVLKILPEETNKGELAAFISYAIAFPTNFLALVDTYDVLKSGVPNFLAVARALHECNYQAVGLRIDSGDLAYLSLEVRAKFVDVSKKFNLPYMEHFTIVASNDINEDTLISLEKQGHSIDSFGIGTHLVTCQKQPALGCVYKLVELAGSPRIKVSQDIEKVTIPGRKNLYRLYGHDGKALCDLLTRIDEPEPEASVRILSRHPFSEQKRAYVTPSSVHSLYKLYWADGEIKGPMPSLKQVRTHAREQINELRKDHKRDLNPTPYKVSVTDALFQFMHKLWMKSVPIGELE